MKVKMFTVHDSKAQAFLSPFFLSATGLAVREWSQAVNDEKTAFCRHPADFTLFELGEFDDSTGKITELTSPINLGSALQFKSQPAEVMPLFNKEVSQ